MLEDVTETLETEAFERATTGVPEPVFYKGCWVDTIRKKSDLMLIFLLKARRPEVYRERFDVKSEHSLGYGVTEEIIKGLSDEKLAQLDAATNTIRQIVGGAG